MHKIKKSDDDKPSHEEHSKCTAEQQAKNNHGLTNDEAICHEDEVRHDGAYGNSQEQCETRHGQHVTIEVSKCVDLEQYERLLPYRERCQYSSSNLLQNMQFPYARHEKYLRNQSVRDRTVFNPHNDRIIQSRIISQNSWNDHLAFLFLSSDV